MVPRSGMGYHGRVRSPRVVNVAPGRRYLRPEDGRSWPAGEGDLAGCRSIGRWCFPERTRRPCLLALACLPGTLLLFRQRFVPGPLRVCCRGAGRLAMLAGQWRRQGAGLASNREPMVAVRQVLRGTPVTGMPPCGARGGAEEGQPPSSRCPLARGVGSVGFICPDGPRGRGRRRPVRTRPSSCRGAMRKLMYPFECPQIYGD